MHAVTIGPWVLAVGLVALVVGWIVANLVAWILKRFGQADVGTPLWVLLAVALVVARGAFVVREWQAYAASPWSIVDIRDGGFSWVAGVVVMVLGALVWMWRRPRLRRALATSVGVGLFAWAAVGVAASRVQASAPSALPDLTLETLAGRPVPLADLEGKPLVVNIWATWCGPCRSEMPMLVSESHKLHDVRFVFVDHGEAADTVRHYLTRTGLAPRHVLLDGSGRLMGFYKLPGCPATLFVTPAGRVTDVQLGPMSEASLTAHLHRWLGLHAG